MPNCILKQRDGKWYCTECNGRPLKGNWKRQCKANGRSSAPAPTPVDAAAWMTTYYAKQDYPMLPLSAILAKLERCRSAGCETLRDDVCTMLGSNACKQRSNWFRMLAGGAVCQNWKRKIS